MGNDCSTIDESNVLKRRMSRNRMKSKPETDDECIFRSKSKSEEKLKSSLDSCKWSRSKSSVDVKSLGTVTKDPMDPKPSDDKRVESSSHSFLMCLKENENKNRDYRQFSKQRKNSNTEELNFGEIKLYKNQDIKTIRNAKAAFKDSAFPPSIISVSNKEGVESPFLKTLAKCYGCTKLDMNELERKLTWQRCPVCEI